MYVPARASICFSHRSLALLSFVLLLAPLFGSLLIGVQSREMPLQVLVVRSVEG